MAKTLMLDTPVDTPTDTPTDTLTDTPTDTPTLTTPESASALDSGTAQEQGTQTIAPNSTPDSLPAGGQEGDRFNCKEVWYPIAFVDDLSSSQLTTFTLLDTPLVIWWDAPAQTWRAFEDVCPHRLAPLSEGRIDEAGQIECPYHGWAFDGMGDCKSIPQLPDGSDAIHSPRACANSLPTQVCQGLLFVYPGAAENAPRVPVPTVPALDEPQEEWVCLNTFRDIPYDALTLLENVIDSSHIPYTHHKTVGNRSNAAPMELFVTESGRQRFAGEWPEGPRQGKLGKQTTTFIAPNLIWHDLTSKQFGRTLTVVYATPIRKGECRLFARFPFKFNAAIPKLVMKVVPRWYNHIGQNGILEDDQIFLHLQERALERALENVGGGDRFAKAFYLPTRADAYVTELRKWVNRYHADPFPDSDLPPAYPQEQLLDRYHSHVQHCRSCQGALKNIQRGRQGAIALAFVGVAIAPLLAITLNPWVVGATSIISLISAGTWAGLGQLERRFYQGRSIPPRNQS